MKIDAFHYIQLGTVYRWVKLFPISNKNVYSYVFNLLVAFISVRLRFLSGIVPWQAQTWMNVAVLLEGGFFAPLCVHTDMHTRLLTDRVQLIPQFRAGEVGKLVGHIVLTHFVSGC